MANGVETHLGMFSQTWSVGRQKYCLFSVVFCISKSLWCIRSSPSCPWFCAEVTTHSWKIQLTILLFSLSSDLFLFSLPRGCSEPDSSDTRKGYQTGSQWLLPASPLQRRVSGELTFCSQLKRHRLLEHIWGDIRKRWNWGSAMTEIWVDLEQLSWITFRLRMQCLKWEAWSTPLDDCSLFKLLKIVPDLSQG